MRKTKKRNLDRPECQQHRTACLINSNGYCKGLTDTTFRRSCPFYKTKGMLFEQLPKELAEEAYYYAKS